MNGKLREQADRKQIPYEEYRKDFQANYEREPYYRQGNVWSDYEPAYKYSFDRFNTENASRKWEEVERDMEQGWENAKGESRLLWEDAKDAVRDGWHRLEAAMPGDIDGDGR